MKEEDKLAVRTQNDTGASRQIDKQTEYLNKYICCLLYTSDAADE